MPRRFRWVPTHMMPASADGMDRRDCKGTSNQPVTSSRVIAAGDCVRMHGAWLGSTVPPTEGWLDHIMPAPGMRGQVGRSTPTPRERKLMSGFVKRYAVGGRYLGSNSALSHPHCGPHHHPVIHSAIEFETKRNTKSEGGASWS